MTLFHLATEACGSTGVPTLQWWLQWQWPVRS